MGGWVRKTFKLLRSVKTSGNYGRPLMYWYVTSKLRVWLIGPPQVSAESSYFGGPV